MVFLNVLNSLLDSLQECLFVISKRPFQAHVVGRMIGIKNTILKRVIRIFDHGVKFFQNLDEGSRLEFTTLFLLPHFGSGGYLKC